MGSTTQPTTLYIVRHGQTDANARDIIQGQSESYLTAEGELQAESLRDKLQHIHFDALFSSDLTRAKRTAEILNTQRQLTINTSKLLRERRFGKYEGQSRQLYVKDNKELMEQIKHLSREEQNRYKVAEDIESIEEMTQRLLSVLGEISAMCGGKNVLIVSHGGAIRFLLTHLGWMDDVRGADVENGGTLVLESDDINFLIKETIGIVKK